MSGTVVLDQMRTVTVVQSSPSTLVTVSQAGMQGPQGNPTTVNGHTGASITLTAADVSAVSTSLLGAVNGVATLDSGGLVPYAELPVTTIAGSFMDLSTNQSIATGTKTFTAQQLFLGGVGGSAASGGNLALSSTSNATKGKITFGTSVYDEVNNRLGLRNSSPQVSLHATGATATTGLGRLDVTGDTVGRWTVDASGTMAWGPGGSTATDTTLTRSAAGALTMNGTFQARVFGPGVGVTTWFNVKSAQYGAKGDGTTDDTAAIALAIAAAVAATNGAVYFPAGTYQVTPVSSTVAAFVLNNGTAGYQGIRFVGDGALSSKLRRTAAGPILSMSGPSTSTGATHCKYCTLENIRLDGNGFTSPMLQTYYADDLSFRHVYFGNCPDVVQDTAEFWDSRYYNCVWETNGSVASNALTPNVLLRNSAAASGFGASANNTNQIHFVGCRWEHMTTGAVWIQQGVSNAGSPQGIYFTNCKMETGAINGGPHLLVDANCQNINVDSLYIFSGGFTGGYSTAQDAITWSAQDGTLQNVFIATGASQTIANGVTLNSTVSTQRTVVRNVTAIYSGVPTGNHVAYGTGTGGFILDNCNSNVASATQYAADYLIVGATSGSNTFGSLVSGDTSKRWVSNANGNMSWGSGSASADNQLNRASSTTMAFSKNLLLGALTALGDNGVGELQLANATTVPTTNPTAGGVLYAKQGVPTWRDTAGLTLGMSRTYFQDSTANLATFSTEADVTGATISVVVTGSNATVQVTGYFDFSVLSPASSTTMIGYLSWNGSDRTQQVVFSTLATARGIFSRTWTITGVTAGTYVAKLRASCNISSANNVVEFPHTGLTVNVTEN